MYIQIPVTTEVIKHNEDICTNGKLEDGRIIIDLDTSKRDYKKLLTLPRGTPVRWLNERTFEVQELSSFPWPLVYRIKTADGYYDHQGERVYFTPELKGLSSYRKVSDVTLRLGVWLCVIAGLGCRKAAWLLAVLFRVEVSKSALDRWVAEVAEQLPSTEEMIQLLDQSKPISEGHLDEIFPTGSNSCVLVLKDEHGRIVATEEVKERDEAHVIPFLERLKGLGLPIKTFYIDHWPAYANAISAVYPAAEIQYDYFHILQNIWRHVMDEFRAYRRDVKARSEASQTKHYAAQLKALASKLWKHRYLFFKSERNMTAAELNQALEIINSDNTISFLRGFLHKVWAIFDQAKSEAEARQKLEELKDYATHEPNESGLRKAIDFLEKHFPRMTTFLRVPGVKRNSLAESGMRVLRRLEQSHDGFRSEKGRQNALKIYQAVMYLGWSIHDPPNLKEKLR